MARAGEMTKMTMSDGASIGVYHVKPSGARRGGLVLIQEIFGVTEHIQELCDGYAADGYEVLAPALYDREAPGLQASYSPEDIQKAFKIARELHPFALSIADTQTCIDALKGSGPVFITGYCYGGSVSWAAACRCDGLAAASGYYGSLIPQLAAEKPKCPTILHFGKHDAGIPLEGVKKVEELHPDVSIYLYDAGHGFNSDRRTDYNAECAKQARDRTLALFQAHAG
jgi:carboxymethylenebutenolidase